MILTVDRKHHNIILFCKSDDRILTKYGRFLQTKLTNIASFYRKRNRMLRFLFTFPHMIKFVQVLLTAVSDTYNAVHDLR